MYLSKYHNNYYKFKYLSEDGDVTLYQIDNAEIIISLSLFKQFKQVKNIVQAFTDYPFYNDGLEFGLKQIYIVELYDDNFVKVIYEYKNQWYSFSIKAIYCYTNFNKDVIKLDELKSLMENHTS